MAILTKSQIESEQNFPNALSDLLNGLCMLAAPGIHIEKRLAYSPSSNKHDIADMQALKYPN